MNNLSDLARILESTCEDEAGKMAFGALRNFFDDRERRQVLPSGLTKLEEISSRLLAGILACSYTDTVRPRITQSEMVEDSTDIAKRLIAACEAEQSKVTP